jgi:prepilin-type processing-associated H-X9-DG protein
MREIAATPSIGLAATLKAQGQRNYAFVDGA